MICRRRAPPIRASEPAVQRTRARLANQQYEAAHEPRYTKQDLLGALRLYEDLISAPPDTPEAQYTRTQLQNTANSVVPEPETDK